MTDWVSNFFIILLLFNYGIFQLQPLGERMGPCYNSIYQRAYHRSHCGIVGDCNAAVIVVHRSYSGEQHRHQQRQWQCCFTRVICDLLSSQKSKSKVSSLKIQRFKSKNPKIWTLPDNKIKKSTHHHQPPHNSKVMLWALNLN